MSATTKAPTLPNAKQMHSLERIEQGNHVAGFAEPTLRALMVRGLIEFGRPTERTSYRPVFNLTPVFITESGRAAIQKARLGK